MAKKLRSAAPTLNDIPDEVLARVLSFARPSLRLLLVSKRWCKVAIEECPALWRAVSVRGDPYLHALARQRRMDPGATYLPKEPDRKAKQAARRSTLAGFRRVAGHFQQLFFTCDWDDVVPLIPQLLALAGTYSPHLENVQLSVPLADVQAYKGALQTISRMRTLRTLKVCLMSQGPIYPSCSYLRPLSALTQLHSLDLDLEEGVGTLPPSLLPLLQHLTHLGLSLDYVPWEEPDQVSWGCGAPGSPRLRSLRLRNAWLRPEEATLASLGQLGSLRLQGCCPVPIALRTLLHSLAGFTSLELDDAYPADLGDVVGPVDDEESGREWLLGLLAGCGQLRRLELHDAALIQMDIPAGALQDLSYLSLDDRHVTELHLPVSWASLPSLGGLRLAGKALYTFKPPRGGLGVLKELDIGALDFNWGQHEQMRLPCLTRLVMNEISLKQAVPPKRILEKLRHLFVEYFDTGNTLQQVLKKLPDRLGQATSLEVLDLRGCRSLELHKADAEVLRQLKNLRRLEVNAYQGRGVITFLRKQLPDLEVVEEQQWW